MIFLIILWAILILLAAALVIAMKPGDRRDVSTFSGKLYAHRGLYDNKGGVPENSLLAFRRAKEAGFGVELDVQLTADNRLVVFHDGNVKRMCGEDKNVFAMTYDELSKLRLLGTDEKIPLFSEVLDLLGDTLIVCEIKTHSSNTDMSVCTFVYDMIKGKKNICIESFNPYAVKWFKQNHPEVIRGQLSQDFMKNGGGLEWPKRFLLYAMSLNILSAPDFIAYRHEDADSIPFKVCKALYHPFCVAWTVKSQESQDKLWQDFDSMIFEGFTSKK